MSHVKQKRSESRPVSTDSREKELDKMEEADKVPIRITIKADSPGVGTQPNCGSRPTVAVGLRRFQEVIAITNTACAWILLGEV